MPHQKMTLKKGPVQEVQEVRHKKKYKRGSNSSNSCYRESVVASTEGRAALNGVHKAKMLHI